MSQSKEQNVFFPLVEFIQIFPSNFEYKKKEEKKKKYENSIDFSFHFPERFQWRTSVSYYMCWYTMMGVQELANFGESCDNFANCLDEYGPSNKDPRADDAKPFACALYSFCPDHCCPMKHIWHMRDCFQSKQNPCYAVNFPGTLRIKQVFFFFLQFLLLLPFSFINNKRAYESNRLNINHPILPTLLTMKSTRNLTILRLKKKRKERMKEKKKISR